MDNNGVNKVRLTNTMALVGFVMSFFQPTVGLILSIIAMNQIKKTNEDGSGLALAGIIISSILLVILLFILFIYFIFILDTILYL